MRALIALALLLPSLALAQPRTPPPIPIPTEPCDLLSQGCLSAWSVVERVTRSYSGPLFQAVLTSGPSAGATALIGSIAQTGMVDLNALHAFCDGYDCRVQTLYDQFGLNPLTSNAGTAPFSGHRPLIGWKANGLPEIIITQNNEDGSAGTAPYAGQYLYNLAPVGLPTTGSRATYMVSDSGAASASVGEFRYGAIIPNIPLGGNWYIELEQPYPNNQQSILFGGDVDNQLGGASYSGIGTFPAGFAQIAGVWKYNQPAVSFNASLLTSACVPTLTQPCDTYTTWNGPIGGNTVNTGYPYPVSIGVGYTGDTNDYGGRIQTVLQTSYFPSTAEDSAVLNSLAQSHFPRRPSGCGVNNGPPLPASPLGTLSHATPANYAGVPALNQKALLALWSTSLVNADYSGPLFRIVRQDTSAGFDIWPSGCEADVTALTADCLGTTCNVTVLFDQSGHNWSMRSSNPGVPPTLNITGVNSKPCVQFTATALTQYTGSFAATGVLTVTAIASGSIPVPGITKVPNEYAPQVIYSQLSGEAGSTGTYQTSEPVAQNSASGIFALGTTALYTDQLMGATVAQSSAVALYQNATMELVVMPPTTPTALGNFFGQYNGWEFYSNASRYVILGDVVGSTTYLTSAAMAANQANFVYWQGDASTNQNLVLGLNNQPPVTTAFSGTNRLGNSSGTYVMGMGSIAHPATGCVAMAAIYTDKEPPSALLAHYLMAQQKWATP